VIEISGLRPNHGAVYGVRKDLIPLILSERSNGELMVS
jgi:hypothetical protein